MNILIKQKKTFLSFLVTSIFTYGFGVLGSFAQVQGGGAGCISCHDTSDPNKIPEATSITTNCNITGVQFPQASFPNAEVAGYGPIISLPVNNSVPIPIKIIHTKANANAIAYKCANNPDFGTKNCVWNGPVRDWGYGKCATFKNKIECSYDVPGPPKVRYRGWSVNPEDAGCKCCPSATEVPPALRGIKTLAEWQDHVKNKLGCPVPAP